MTVILGGGVAGASLAWALTRRGKHDVMVVDPYPPGTGSTVRSTGGFRTQFASRLNIDLSLASRPFFAEHAKRLDFRPNGYAYLASDEESASMLVEWRRLQRDAGLPVQEVDGSFLFPSLRLDSLVSCNYCALDGVFRARLVLDLYREEASARGARFAYRFGADPSSLDADLIVVAAGIWSTELGRTLGVTLPISPELRHVWFIEGLRLEPTMPLGIDMPGGWVFRERDGCLFVASPPAHEGTQEDFNAWSLRRLPKGVLVDTVREWSGYYEVTFDHHPLVGRTADPGIWTSCGFSGHGIMHSPAIADSLAAMMLGDTPPLDISVLSPLRTIPLREPTVV